MKKVLAVILLVTGSHVFAAHQTKSFLIQFATDEYSLDPTAVKKLDEVSAFLKAHPTAKIKLTGRTDYDGSIGYNVNLSRLRTSEVSEWLQDKGWQNAEIDEKWVGELKPLATNANAGGKALNRSVEILITVINYDNANQWLQEQQEEHEEKFTLKQSGANSITTDNESIINIPPNAFTTLDGKAVDNKNVKVVVTEVNTAMDAIINQVFTMSGDQLLETGGMMKIEAFSNGTQLQLAPNKEINIQIPIVKAASDMQVFEGVADANGNIDWLNTGNGFKASSQELRTSIKLNELALQKLYDQIEYEKPLTNSYDLNYTLPKLVNIPTKPRKPEMPEKKEARKLFSKLGWLLSTKQMKEMRVERTYQNEMITYNKRMITYDKRLKRYEAAIKVGKMEIKQFTTEQEAFSNWIQNNRIKVMEEISSIFLHHDKKRISLGLQTLNIKSKNGTQYSESPYKFLKEYISKSRLSYDESIRLDYLRSLDRALWTLQITDLRAIQKKYAYKNQLRLSRLIEQRGTNSYLAFQTIPNAYFDNYLAANKTLFEQVFETEILEADMRIIEQKNEMALIRKTETYFSGNTKKMGWTNCDRYVQSELANVTFTTFEGAYQVVILEDINSIMCPYHNQRNPDLTFASIPKNSKFKLLTLKIEGDEGYISLNEATAKKGLKIEPQFKKVPLEEINKILAKL